MSALDRCPMHGLELEFSTDRLGRSIWGCTRCQQIGATFTPFRPPVVTHRTCVDCRGAIIGRTRSTRCEPCRLDNARAHGRDYYHACKLAVR